MKNKAKYFNVKLGKAIIVFPSFFVLFLVQSCTKEPRELEVQLTYPSYFPSPVYPFADNEISNAKFRLGKKLFFDPILSIDSTVSCASCHSLVHAFADHNKPLSNGVGNALGTRNAPSIVNMIWSPSFMWDGGVNHLDVFSVAPITNPLEMKESIAHVIHKLKNNSAYQDLFQKAFGEGEINDQKMLRALSIYMALIVSDKSKYDYVRQGKDVFTADEKAGYELFTQKCASCHKEPMFTDYSYRNNGLDTAFLDLGRGRITLNPLDNGKFKVPTLRNIDLTYPYMHDGRFWSLNQVLDHYNAGIKHSETLDSTLQNGIPLTSNQKNKLIKFLKTLTDYKLLSNNLFY